MRNEDSRYEIGVEPERAKGKRRVQDNLHAHAYNELIRNSLKQREMRAMARAELHDLSEKFEIL